LHIGIGAALGESAKWLEAAIGKGSWVVLGVRMVGFVAVMRIKRKRTAANAKGAPKAEADTANDAQDEPRAEGDPTNDAQRGPSAEVATEADAEPGPQRSPNTQAHRKRRPAAAVAATPRRMAAREKRSGTTGDSAGPSQLTRPPFGLLRHGHRPRRLGPRRSRPVSASFNLPLTRSDQPRSTNRATRTAMLRAHGPGGRRLRQRGARPVRA